jgi:hypothetical protein
MKTAIISTCGGFRYLLTRQLGAGAKLATFVMLNPSTADAERDDPTLRRCVAFSRLWGCGRLQVVNLFAFRATNPKCMKNAEDPVGPENAAYVKLAVEGASGPVVCAWGVHGRYLDQDLAMLRWLAEVGAKPTALGITKDGHPKHPLYVPSGTALRPFPARRA